MASTCPYMLVKTTQLCTAARISSQNETFKETFHSNKIVQKLVRFKSNLKLFQPDAAPNLPPRLNIRGFSTAANYLCLQIRIRRLLYLDRTERNFKHADDGVFNFKDENIDAECCGQRVVFRSENGNVNDKSELYFSKHGITEEELGRCVEEIKSIKKNQWLLEENEHKAKSDWSMFLRQKDLVVWRRPLNDNGLYQYKVFGSFFDISSQAFFSSQIDLLYRKSWDKYAIALDIIDRSSKCGSEVVHWVTHFPYPLKSRDYVFIRRSKVDPVSKTMVLVSRAATHEDCPESSEYIRVKDYESQMVIRPHRTFDESVTAALLESKLQNLKPQYSFKLLDEASYVGVISTTTVDSKVGSVAQLEFGPEAGFDYILTYHDDSRVNVPCFCVNMITGSALPDFVKTLHDAAFRIEKHKKRSNSF